MGVKDFPDGVRYRPQVGLPPLEEDHHVVEGGDAELWAPGEGPEGMEGPGVH